MLPNFVIIGAQKSGTSSLEQYLRLHPDVAMCAIKEPDFFVEERNWGRGLAWYESLFDGAGEAVAVGEASTSYTMFPHYRGVPERIVETLPEVRLVYLVRNPIERARSDYLHYRFPVRGRATEHVVAERRPIGQALLENEIYLDTSRYAMQLEQYLDLVPRERILIITTDSLATDRIQTMRKVFAFIGVDPDRGPDAFEVEFNRTDSLRVPRPAFERLSAIPLADKLVALLPMKVRREIKSRPIDLTKAEMSEELRARIGDELRDDVRRFRALMDVMDDDFDGWGLV